MGPVDYIICCIAFALAAAAIVAPSRGRLRVAAILVLTAVATAYTILRPGVRTALAYREKLGGAWSEDWMAGVTSYLAVTRHFSTVVLAAALLLAVVALRSRNT